MAEGCQSLQAVNIRAETVEDAWEKYGESSLPGEPISILFKRPHTKTDRCGPRHSMD